MNVVVFMESLYKYENFLQCFYFVISNCMFKCSNETGKFILEIFSNSVKITTNDYSPFKKKKKKEKSEPDKAFQDLLQNRNNKKPFMEYFPCLRK